MWFSLVCLMIAIRTSAVDQMVILTLFPNLDWNGRLMIASIGTSGFVAFVALYITAAFGNFHNRVLTRVFVCYSIFVAVFRLLTPPAIYVQVTDITNTVVLVLGGLLLFNTVYIMIKKPRGFKVHLEHILILLAVAANVVLAAVEVVLVIAGQFLPQISFMQIGVLIFVIINALALALNFHRTDSELFMEQQRNRESEETNQLLERLNRLKSNFIADINHEMKSPLGIMSSYAELAGWHIEAGTVNADTQKKLRIISEEAHRLASLVERLLDI